jgi:hypothetical protein
VITRLNPLRPTIQSPVVGEEISEGAIYWVKRGTLRNGMKQVKISSVQYEILVALCKRWRMNPEELIAELIEENYNSQSKQ